MMPTPDEEQPPRRMSAGEQWDRYGRYPYLLAKLIFITILVGGALWAIVQVSAVAVPLFFSLLLAYLLNPSVGKMQARGIPRPAGILAIILGVIAFLVVFSVSLYPTIAAQTTKILERVPEVMDVLETRTLPWLSDNFNVTVPETVAEAMETYGEQVQQALPVVAEQAATWARNALLSASTLVITLLNLVLIPLFTFYFLRDFEAGKKGLVRFVPPVHRETVLDRLHRMDVVFGQWFRGQIQVSLILAVLYAIGLGIVYGVSGLDVQSGVVIGLLTGLLNVVPYVGFAVGSLLAFLVVVIDWTGWGAVIGLIIAFSVIQTFESYYLTPRIVGDKVGLKPVTVIIMLLIGGHVAGLIGVLLAIPITGALKVLLPDLIHWYERTSLYTGKHETSHLIAVSLPDALIAVEANEGSEGADGTSLVQAPIQEKQAEADSQVQPAPVPEPVPEQEPEGRKAEEADEPDEGGGDQDSDEGEDDDPDRPEGS